MDSSTEREKFDGKTPDTPESLALWVWDKFVGCPITEPYDAMYLLLLERLKFMHRATFTAGLHEALRQRAALDSSGVREPVASTPDERAPAISGRSLANLRELILDHDSEEDSEGNIVIRFNCAEWMEIEAALPAPPLSKPEGE